MDFKFLIIFFVAVLTLGIVAQEDPPTTTVAAAEPPATTTLSPAETTTKSAAETTTKSAAETTTKSAAETTTKSAAETTTENSSESTTADPTTTTPKPPPSFADNVNTATQNLLGVNCMVQAIYNVEDLVPNFQYEIESCGSKAQTEAASTLKKVNNLQTKCSKVVKVNDKTCKNANFNQNSDAAKQPSDKCIKDIKKAMDELNESVAATIDNVEKYYKKTTNSCARMAFLKFKLNLNNFNAIISACAKISSNA